MGKPDNPEGYNTIAQEDITIFIDPNIKDKNIKVSLTKWLFIKSLTAEAL